MIGNNFKKKGSMMIKKFLLQFFLLFLFSCALNGEESQDMALPDSFFKPTSGVQKIFAVGTVKYKGSSNFEKAKCPPEGICMHLNTWQIYELDGYILPEKEDTESVLVAHYYHSALVTDTPWLARLEKISDAELRKKIGADYILVGVELGYNVFCPSNGSASEFKEWKEDFVNKRTKKACFAL